MSGPLHHTTGAPDQLQRRLWVLAAAVALALGGSLIAQTAPVTRPAPAASVPPELAGRTVEEVRIVGRTRPLGSALLGEIRQQIRTAEGSKFDPETVREDYQRVYGLRKFSSAEARIELTAGGVAVIFEVSEQDLIRAIRLKGNREIDTTTLLEVIDLTVGQSIDAYRLAAARQSIERLYRGKNYPYAHVEVDGTALVRDGEVVFTVIEGPKVTVRKVAFAGNTRFSDGKLDDQIKTSSWWPVLRAGTLELDQVEQDVAAIRQFYEDRGFFDVRVGRKILFGPDQTEAQVLFVIDEGKQYLVDRILFKGNSSLSDEALRQTIKLQTGRPFERDIVRKDLREVIRAYSPLGFVYYQPHGAPPNPDYFQVRTREVFHREAGKVDVVYEISEGRPFRTGRILVTGNQKTSDKVVLREMRVAPGALYNSGELQDAVDRIRGTQLYSDARITPIGSQPAERDVLVEVTEQPSSRILLGGAVTSNSGIIGNITYEQKNFDISAWPTRFSDITDGRAFVGAGQFFRVNLEPGTEFSRASIDFVEPWVFDQPYSFGVSAFLSDRIREHYNETRIGGRLSVGRRFLPHWSVRVSLRGEDVQIREIEDEPERAREVVELDGHSTLTSVGLEVKRDTTNSPILPTRGSISAAQFEYVGALGGDFTFSKLSLSWDLFQTVWEDMLARKTTLRYHADAGFIQGEAPFFERFYGGGLDNVRGFAYRGISPRSGPDEDPVGGDFLIAGGLELNFPLYEETIRGVVFVDAGTVERDVRLGTIRSSVGFGIRWTLPFFGQVPLAFNFAVPLTKDDQDDKQFFSFSLGLYR